VRKGARVIREIAWRLREIGNDGRICDLIDSQVEVIERGAEQITSDEAKAALEAAFASIAGRIAEFSDEEMSGPVAEAFEPAPAQEEAAQASINPVSTDAVVPAAEAAAMQADAALEQMEAAGIEPAEAVELTAEAADAHDEAVLDMIAMEMGAPDPFEDDEIAEPAVEEAHIAEPVVEEAQRAEPPPIEPETVAELPEPMAAPVEPPVQPLPQPVAQAVPEPALEVSLGSSIIASGLVRRPVAANDPLAPIRRMSQAEKIAFFS
jgi:chemotaxis protein histidine kinase CheA